MTKEVADRSQPGVKHRLPDETDDKRRHHEGDQDDEPQRPPPVLKLRDGHGQDEPQDILDGNANCCIFQGVEIAPDEDRIAPQRGIIGKSDPSAAAAEIRVRQTQSERQKKRNEAQSEEKEQGRRYEKILGRQTLHDDVALPSTKSFTTLETIAQARP
jgi:hypothetical protein